MKNNQKTWKIIDILKTTTDFFASKDIENPRLNAEQLLAFLLNISRVQLYIQFEQMLSNKEVSAFRELIRRRVNHEPLQYILGETEFMGHNFKVTPAVLIPRPETEFLVEQVIQKVQQLHLNTLSILDIGTGSGCMAISLAHFFPQYQVTATDISREALEVAKYNATENKIKNVNFIHHNILSSNKLPITDADIVVSNPPYISENEMDDLPQEIKNYEPKIALTDFDTGLNFYEKILSLIEKDRKCKFVFMEMNANLHQQITKVAENLGFKKVEVIPDLNGLPRILQIEK